MLENLPDVGIHRGVDESTYHAWGGASNSRLTILFNRSAAHLRAEIDNPGQSTPAQVLGTAIHYAVIEPDDFARRVVKSPKFNRRSNAGKQEAEDFELANLGKIILDEDDFAACLAIRDSVFAHEWARKILDRCRDRELSIVWDDAETGVRCRARLDLFDAPLALIADVKSTVDASPRAFAKTVLDMGYHRQAGMYTDGARAVGLNATDFVHIAVEKRYPYAVGVYRLDDDAVALGRSQLRTLLRGYAWCLEHDEWPAYPKGISSLTLPRWAFTD